MPAQASESLVLRTYPLRGGDLIVSFFTREAGKLRGVARSARKPKNQFGAGLERLSHVHLFYTQRENRELAMLTRCEIIQSQIAVVSDYGACVALDYVAEVSENLLPPGEPNELFFRLLLAVLSDLRRGPAAAVWPAVNYFSLWAVRLSGFLGDLRISADSRRLAEEMMQTPIGQQQAREWTAQTGADLRRSLIRAMQDHIERRLQTVPLLESI